MRHTGGVRPRARAAALLPLAVLLPALLAACSGSDSAGDPGAPAAAGGNVFAERPQTVLPNPRVVAAARQAEADGDQHATDVLDPIAGVPTEIWLTPEQLPVDQVGGYVTNVVAEAGSSTVPLFVIYGIPDRDCTGVFSAGGLTVDTYLPWVQAIADAAGDTSAVVLEPDALASSVACTGDTDRIRLLTHATEALDADGVTTYLDAGHSYWVPAPKMARLLSEIGVASVRGFATNVSNYQPLSRERAYASQLSGLLDGAHYVIDTGRDGDPSGAAQPVEDWCNPVDQALGDEPGYVDDGSPLDGLLWIKPPAESDGPCHGGPDAGEIWIERAVQLGEAAGW
ncbi:glycoside hydrolase family 6 protein [soil metagenome]